MTGTPKENRAMAIAMSLLDRFRDADFTVTPENHEASRPPGHVVPCSIRWTGGPPEETVARFLAAIHGGGITVRRDEPVPCTCVTECDCQSYPKMTSMECPVHNKHPNPNPECPAHGESAGV